MWWVRPAQKGSEGNHKSNEFMGETSLTISAVRPPNLWNELPKEVVELPSLDVSKPTNAVVKYKLWGLAWE